MKSTIRTFTNKLQNSLTRVPSTRLRNCCKQAQTTIPTPSETQCEYTPINDFIDIHVQLDTERDYAFIADTYSRVETMYTTIERYINEYPMILCNIEKYYKIIYMAHDLINQIMSYIYETAPPYTSVCKGAPPYTNDFKNSKTKLEFIYSEMSKAFMRINYIYQRYTSVAFY
mgnify:CR=1 FL=1